MPPKNMISVSRKSHMPKAVASRCCSTVSKWWRRYAGCAWSCSGPACSAGRAAIAWLSNGRHLVLGFVREPIVIVGLVVDDRRLDEVLGERRGLGLPLESSSLPRIRPGDRSILQRPGHVQHRHKVADPEHGRPGGGEDIQHLELRRIGMIAARHAQIADDELREESQV